MADITSGVQIKSETTFRIAGTFLRFSAKQFLRMTLNTQSFRNRFQASKMQYAASGAQSKQMFIKSFPISHND